MGLSHPAVEKKAPASETPTSRGLCLVELDLPLFKAGVPGPLQDLFGEENFSWDNSRLPQPFFSRS